MFVGVTLRVAFLMLTYDLMSVKFCAEQNGVYESWSSTYHQSSSEKHICAYVILKHVLHKHGVFFATVILRKMMSQLHVLART